MVLRCSLRPSFFHFLWYLLRAFVLFLIKVSSSVHQGTDLLVIVFFVVRCLKDLSQAAFSTSWNSSINFSMSVPSLALLLSVTSRSTDPPSVFVVLSLSSEQVSLEFNYVFTFHYIPESLAVLFTNAPWALPCCEFNDTVTRTAFLVTDFPVFHSSE